MVDDLKAIYSMSLLQTQRSAASSGVCASQNMSAWPASKQEGTFDLLAKQQGCQLHQLKLQEVTCLPLLVGHSYIYGQPADQSWVQLTELLQVEAAQARVQLAPNEEVIQPIACMHACDMTPHTAAAWQCAASVHACQGL